MDHFKSTRITNLGKRGLKPTDGDFTCPPEKHGAKKCLFQSSKREADGLFMGKSFSSRIPSSGQTPSLLSFRTNSNASIQRAKPRRTLGHRQLDKHRQKIQVVEDNAIEDKKDLSPVSFVGTVTTPFRGISDFPDIESREKLYQNGTWSVFKENASGSKSFYERKNALEDFLYPEPQTKTVVNTREPLRSNTTEPSPRNSKTPVYKFGGKGFSPSWVKSPKTSKWGTIPGVLVHSPSPPEPVSGWEVRPSSEPKSPPPSNLLGNPIFQDIFGNIQSQRKEEPVKSTLCSPGEDSFTINESTVIESEALLTFSGRAKNLENIPESKRNELTSYAKALTEESRRLDGMLASIVKLLGDYQNEKKNFDTKLNKFVEMCEETPNGINQLSDDLEKTLTLAKTASTPPLSNNNNMFVGSAQLRRSARLRMSNASITSIKLTTTFKTPIRSARKSRKSACYTPHSLSIRTKGQMSNLLADS